MKKQIILLAGLGILCSFARVDGQETKEHLTREFTLTGNVSTKTLFIYNISGSIEIEGSGNGNKIILEMDKTISAETNKDLETGNKEFKLGYDQKSDSLIVYIAAPVDSRPHTRNNNYNDIDYDFNVDFKVKVPEGINLQISTVNNGIVAINNVGGNLHITNVNEEIRITNAKSRTVAHTVNGDVTVTYKSNPVEESSYKTINGDIRVTYLQDLSADLTFKTLNGEFFTDFASAKLLPSATKKTEQKKGGSTVYKLDSKTSVRFGNGGKTFTFETLNGDVYIKKQS